MREHRVSDSPFSLGQESHQQLDSRPERNQSLGKGTAGATQKRFHSAPYAGGYFHSSYSLDFLGDVFRSRLQQKRCQCMGYSQRYVNSGVLCRLPNRTAAADAGIRTSPGAQRSGCNLWLFRCRFSTIPSKTVIRNPSFFQLHSGPKQKRFSYSMYANICRNSLSQFSIVISIESLLCR